MKINRVYKIFFSPTGTTEKAVSAITAEIARNLGCETDCFDFTLPQARTASDAADHFPALSPEDLVVFGCPTYAGRLPNLLLKYLHTIRGNGAFAVPVVTFGNRNYDNSLIELRDLLETQGFHTIAGAACSCEHSFSRTLGAGRPDTEDLAELCTFAGQAAEKIRSAKTTVPPVQVPGVCAEEDHGGYYQPRDRHGVFIDIRKVKPLTDREKCFSFSSADDGCGICAAVCPMGSIDLSDITQVTGICIKCGACIKKCPAQAKYYDDPGYLYHKTELEEMYARRAANNFFF
ncbi:MAG: ferredoxin [Anaerovoracaceae bacterium]